MIVNKLMRITTALTSVFATPCSERATEFDDQGNKTLTFATTRPLCRRDSPAGARVAYPGSSPGFVTRVRAFAELGGKWWRDYNRLDFFRLQGLTCK